MLQIRLLDLVLDLVPAQQAKFQQVLRRAFDVLRMIPDEILFCNECEVCDEVRLGRRGVSLLQGLFVRQSSRTSAAATRTSVS